MFKIIIFLFLFLFPSNISAAENKKFSVSYDIHYQVAESGLTTVTQNITLTNLTSEFYASQYSSKIGPAKIQNLRAFDRLGPIPLSFKDGALTLTFNDRVYGKDRTLKWKLVFDSPEIAKKIGRLWEINLPPGPSDENLTDYKFSLSTPLNFPPLLYDKITSKTYGDYQVANFRLKYNLKNEGIFPAAQEIALPPDTAYQKVILTRLDPRPLSARFDSDGNYLVRYSLNPRQKITVAASGQAQILPFPQSCVSPNFQDYLYPQKYWEATDPEIFIKAQELATPENIYSFVSRYLIYNSKSSARLGALNALRNPQNALCTEFTDLFIALARSVNIPARQLAGYANTFHTWPEYFDYQINNWRPVDPTWAATTGLDYFHAFDLNHLVFTINGLNPLKPQPPNEAVVTFEPTLTATNSIIIPEAKNYDPPSSFWQIFTQFLRKKNVLK